MSDDTKGFLVKDRRHFTAEGETREPALAGVSAAPVEPPAQSPSAPQRPARSAPPAVGDAVDFSSFLLSLGAQAGSLLAGADPQARDGEALAAGRQIISVMEMLEAKTEGRRTPDEDRLLESLLFELRLAYVEATGGVRA
jgi:hypothetical protein